MLHEIEQVLFPSRCVLCGRYLLQEYTDGYPLCRSCEQELRQRMIAGPRCGCCGRPLLGELQFCTACRSRSFSFASVYPLGLYEGALARVLKAYKAEEHKLLARFFADLLAPVLSTRGEGALLVRVPSRPGTVRRRGWDHTGEIVRHLSSRYGLHFLPLLRRGRSRAQKGLDYRERGRNLQGKIDTPACRDLQGGAVLCFDDVFTTGATLDVCAAVLKSAGAGEVRAVVIAADP